MDRFTKADIEFHSDHGFDQGGSAAINVKAHHFGDRHTDNGWQYLDAVAQIQADFGGSEAEAQHAYDMALECATDDFWGYLAPETATDILAPIFGPVRVFSEGRSGGWLVVMRDYGTGRMGPNLGDRDDVEGWDAIKVAAWGRFAARIRAEVDFLCDYEQIKETIDANDWMDRAFERAGMVEVQ